LADEAGFDMLEVHAAHGYLLASFLSPLCNCHNDQYGGNVQNRLRFPLRVIRRMRDEWPDEKPMSVRISATDWAPGGISGDDVGEIALAFKQVGIDVINVSTGQTVSYEKPVYGRMFQVPFSDRIRHAANIPTIVAGNISTADQVNTILMAGRADLVALARPHLIDPNVTLHAGAWYQVPLAAAWSKPYHSAMFQAYRLAERDKEEWRNMKRAVKPPTHQASD
jgi:anthraniloyl-CoA monooxygenase